MERMSTSSPTEQLKERGHALVQGLPGPTRAVFSGGAAVTDRTGSGRPLRPRRAGSWGQSALHRQKNVLTVCGPQE